MAEPQPFFGLDGSTGKYLLTAEPEDIARLAIGDELGPGHVDDIRLRLDRTRPSLGVADTVQDVTDLSQTGWGVIFGPDITPESKEALAGLLAHRRAQASQQHPAYYQEYEYRAGETKQVFLSRLHVPPSGAADPARMPYYLLIVGDPQAVPYSFQYQLDVQYAVGRIHFNTPDEYANYAGSVVQSEAGAGPRRVMSFFGVRNTDDVATSLSATRLIAPLAERARLQQSKRVAGQRWEVQSVLAEATKDRLRSLLGGPETPGLLFTASHGIGFPAGDWRQREYQGALVCDDWPGPKQWGREVPRDFYFAAEDVDDQATLRGMIAFHFACYGAGTPQVDDYPQLHDRTSVRNLGVLGPQLARIIAERGFVARLSQRLLGHPRGGALAIVGHVERALGQSFLPDGDTAARSSVGVFEDMIGRLTRGVPVGNAVEPFNQRYAELCADLTNEIREVQQSAKRPNAEELARLWIGSADARGYVIVGDPAVRLAPAQTPTYAAEVHTVDIGAPSDMDGSPHISPPPSRPVESPGAPVSAAIRQGQGLRIEVDSRTGIITMFTAQPGGDSRIETSLPTTGDVSFGLFGGDGALGELRSSMAEGIKNAGAQLVSLLNNIANDITTVEVVTYVSDDLDQVEFDATTRRFAGGARRRAMTRARVDGSIEAILPQTDGKIDEAVWAIHRELVNQAQAQRLELLKSLAAIASGLLSPLKGM